MTEPSTSLTPSRARFILLTYLCALTFVLYLDRVCISQAMSSMQRDLNFSELEAAYVHMAFQLAYGLFELPTGHWGDRVGSRAVLARIAVWWSLFTALTAACFGLYSLLIVRFLFGVGEAGALPNVARVVARWFPPNERSRIAGIVQTAMVLGGATSPLLAAYIIELFGWRWAFVLFGLTGIVWAWFFYRWFRDDPAEHPAVNAAELELLSNPGTTVRHHDRIPWRAVLGNRSLYLLAVIMICSAFNSYVYLSWFSNYLQKGRGLEQIEAGPLTSLVLFGSGVGMFLGGFVADGFAWFRWPIPLARRLFGASAFLAAAALLYLGMQCESPLATSLFAALSILTTTATLATWWACITEISGKHLGALFGLVNGVGFLGAFSSQFFFGWFANYRGNLGYTGREQWDPAFYACIAVLLLAGGCWACYVSRPVLKDDNHEIQTPQIS